MLGVGGDRGLPGLAVALPPPGGGYPLCFVHASQSCGGLPRGQAMLQASGLPTDPSSTAGADSLAGGAAREKARSSFLCSNCRKGAKAHAGAQERGIWAGSGEAGQVRLRGDIDGVPGGDSISQALILERKIGPGKGRRWLRPSQPLLLGEGVQWSNLPPSHSSENQSQDSNLPQFLLQPLHPRGQKESS